MKTLLNILSLPKTKSIAMIFFMVLVSLLFISAINYKSAAHISDVEVEIDSILSGNTMITGEEIRSYVLKNSEIEVIDISVVDVNTRLIEGVLLKHPNISKADVYIDAHNVLRCKISQKVPVYRVMNDSGSYYLSREGERIPLSSHYTARTIILSGAVPTFSQELNTKDKKRVEDLLTFYEFLEKDDFFLKLIDHVSMKQNGDIIISPVLGDFIIHFGNTDKLESKLVRLKTFYSEIMKHESWDKYKYIDLRYNDQLIAKKR